MLSKNRPCFAPKFTVKSSPQWSFLIFFLVVLCWGTLGRCMTDDQIGVLRQETGDIFYHGFDNYMKYAFPEDELRPLSCAPLTRDRANPAHVEINDVLGNYSLTLVDSLSTLAILASSPPSHERRNKALDKFHDGVAALVEQYGDGSQGPGGQGRRARGFDLDSKVQVFETVIRGVGGLLSAHLFAVGELPIRGYKPRVQMRGAKKGIIWNSGFVYDGQLLRLATDLADRLLPAFNTPTGMPYPRVNLRHGISFYHSSPLNIDAEHGQCGKEPPSKPEITETCSAGAGSLVLEFTTLSRLTGDGRYEKAARDAFWAVWARRSNAGLIGGGIDAESGLWVSPFTGIGAGIDSFFEYAFKSHVLLSGLPQNSTLPSDASSEDFLSTWQIAHEGIRRHVYRGASYHHPHYIQADLYTGAFRAFWIDSLSAYYPGLLTLAGELEEAIEAHLFYTALWTRYSALPERWSTATGDIEMGLRWWGGRPEFIESTWYLYHATQDPWYLHVGEMALRDIKRRCWTTCGWAGLQDVRTGEQSDRMESFFLGETAKYLFLLFDPDHPLNRLDAPFVFTTEGHPLIVPRSTLQPLSSFDDNIQNDAEDQAEHVLAPTCPLPPPALPFSISATAARADIFHAASLARLHLMPPHSNPEAPLVQSSINHPGLSIADLISPTNYTFYPWTLPRELVPANGTSSKMAIMSTFDLSFPTMPNAILNAGALQRTGDGILINSLSGVKLGMVREPVAVGNSGHAMSEELFRIHAVSYITLGRDEKVFLPRGLVAGFNPVDPVFTRTRDASMLDLVVDLTVPGSVGDSHTNPLDSLLSSEVGGNRTLILGSNPDIIDQQSFLDTFINQVSSLLTDSKAQPESSIIRQHIPAIAPTGIGAAPLPDVEQQVGTIAEPPALPWTSIYFSDETCTEKLPSRIPREHQVIVMKRGGCSFSDKLHNIPSYVPSPTALQLVVVVSFHNDHGDSKDGGFPLPEATLIRPLLDQVQYTPSGIPRPHPIPMVMTGGGLETYEMLRRAKGVGLRRRYHFMSQGLPISNLIVL